MFQNSCERVFIQRGVRVVEGARLESVYMGNCIEGSNPFLSAIFFLLQKNFPCFSEIFSYRKSTMEQLLAIRMIFSSILRNPIWEPSIFTILYLQNYTVHLLMKYFLESAEVLTKKTDWYQQKKTTEVVFLFYLPRTGIEPVTPP